MRRSAPASVEWRTVEPWWWWWYGGAGGGRSVGKSGKVGGSVDIERYVFLSLEMVVSLSRTSE